MFAPGLALLVLAGSLTAIAQTALTLQVVEPQGLRPPEQALLASAQGLLNRQGPQVWIRAGGLPATRT